MTCIIGVVCADGIVLVGDKKIKTERMAGFENKIIPVRKYRNTVLAAAGLLDIRDKFMQDIENLPVLLEKGIIKEDPSRRFVGLTEDIARRLWEIYGPRYKARGYDYESEAFAALVCYKPPSMGPRMYYIDAVGTSKKVYQYEVVGTGLQYAHLFIKPSHPEEEPYMRPMAVLATFIILLIDKYKIDESIGADEEGRVQIWMFPNDTDAYEASAQDLEEIVNEARERLEKFSYFLILGRTEM